MNAKRLIAIVVVAIVVVGALSFTKPGKRVLNSLGFAAACESGSCD